MQIIVLTEGDPIPIEIDPEGDSNTLLQLVAAETGKPINEFYLDFEGQRLPIGMQLVQLGIYDGSVVSQVKVSAIRSIESTAPVHQAAATAGAAVTASAVRASIYDIPANVKPEELLKFCQDNPHVLGQLQHSDPDLANTVRTNDVLKVRAFMMKRMMQRHKEGYDRQQDLIQLANDPENPELQKRIEEQIRQENINANMEAAMENLPEAFGRVTMLYVNIAVNSIPVKAFVDSGAQSTIMSMRCAEMCNITHLIDTRFAGQARGVGTAKIIGRVHIAQMKFGNSYFPISITILENNDVDFLFGLDTLRRYRCCIDLERNLLRIDGANGIEEIPFLSESELPNNAKGSAEMDVVEEGK